MQCIYFLALFLCVVSAVAQFGNMPSRLVESPNKQFSAELTEIDPTLLLVTVFRRDGDQKTVQWSRRVPVKLPEFPRMSRLIVRDLHLSNDGAAFVALWSMGGLCVATRDGSKALTVPDMLKLLNPKGRSEFRPLTGMPFILVDEEAGRERFCYWDSEFDEWLVVEFANLAFHRAEGEERRGIDALARQRALKKVAEHQNTPFRSLLDPIRRTAAGVVPGISAPVSPGQLFERARSSYMFLAARQVPEDRKLIEKLLRQDAGDVFLHSTGAGAHIRVASAPRALADGLLAVWDGRAKERRGPLPQLSQEQYFYLGRASGVITLPIPLPDKPGELWIYLIPATVPLERWSEDQSVRGFRCPLGTSPNNSSAVEEVRFSLGTIDPGEYRFKAVWDRRPPSAPHDADVLVPGPGDYESAESAPFKIEAGGTAANIMLACTNRVGESEAREYFAADELWRREHKAIFLERELDNESSDGKTVFIAPLRDWMVETNSNQAIRLTKIKLVHSAHQLPGGITNALPALSISFMVLDENLENRPFTPLLRDSHGCTWRGLPGFPDDRFQTAVFTAFPRSAHEFTFALVPLGPWPNKEEAVASFRIKNLQRLDPPALVAEPLPARREINGLTAVLTTVAKGEKFQFFENGAETGKWYARVAHYTNAAGQVAEKIEDFCREDRVLNVQTRFWRTAAAEFSTNEMLKLPLSIPGAGQYKQLNRVHQLNGLRLELLAIAGPGEFNYDGREIVSASAELKPSSLGRFASRGKIELKPQFGPGPKSVMNFQSRFPHLSVAIHNWSDDYQFLTLDGADSDFGRSSSGIGGVWTTYFYIPLDPAGTNLTLVLQKAVKASFTVQYPPTELPVHRR